MLPDLNLLRVFDVLLAERNVTKAGARLGLTQSAVSHALKRLRQMLGDDLFVRSSSGMQPTPKALEMGPQIRAALNQLQTALIPPAFEPATSERRFNLIAGAYPCAVLVPPLVGLMEKAAPGLELAIEDPTQDLLERLDAHRADFLIAAVLSAPERFNCDRLISEPLVWAVRTGHPLVTGGQRTDLEALVSFPHVVIVRRHVGDGAVESRGLATRNSWEDAGALHAAMTAQGLTRRVGVTAPDTQSALAIAARSDMAALVPRRLAQFHARQNRVAMIEPPYDSPPAHLDLVCLKDRLREPGIAWMRDLMLSAAAGL